MVDGYSAPLTAGNFVRNVLEGAYTNAQLKVDQGAVLAGSGFSGGTSGFCKRCKLWTLHWLGELFSIMLDQHGAESGGAYSLVAASMEVLPASVRCAISDACLDVVHSIFLPSAFRTKAELQVDRGAMLAGGSFSGGA